MYLYIYIYIYILCKENYTKKENKGLLITKDKNHHIAELLSNLCTLLSESSPNQWLGKICIKSYKLRK